GHAGHFGHQPLVARARGDAGDGRGHLGVEQRLGHDPAGALQRDQVLAGAVHHLGDRSVGQHAAQGPGHALGLHVEQEDGVAGGHLGEGQVRPPGAFADEFGIQPDAGGAGLEAGEQGVGPVDPGEVGVHRRQGTGRAAAAPCPCAGCAARPRCRTLTPVTARTLPPLRPAPPRRLLAAAALALLLAAGCGRDQAPADAAGDDAAAGAAGEVTISGDDRMAGRLTWRAPAVELGSEEDAVEAALARAAGALEAGDLDRGPGSAIPLYQAVLAREPAHADARAGLERALAALLEQGDEALARAGDDEDALHRAQEIAAVARSLRAGDEQVRTYLGRVDRAEHLADINRAAEAELRGGRLGEAGGGALARVREALAIDAAQPRALQIQAAVESAMIRRAEDAAAEGDFETAGTWLGHAAAVREDARTVADARARVDARRRAWILRLRDEGIAALAQANGIEQARVALARMLALAEPGNPAV